MASPTELYRLQGAACLGALSARRCRPLRHSWLHCRRTCKKSVRTTAEKGTTSKSRVTLVRGRLCPPARTTMLLQKTHVRLGVMTLLGAASKPVDWLGCQRASKSHVLACRRPARVSGRLRLRLFLVEEDHGRQGRLCSAALRGPLHSQSFHGAPTGFHVSAPSRS